MLGNKEIPVYATCKRAKTKLDAVDFSTQKSKNKVNINQQLDFLHKKKNFEPPKGRTLNRHSAVLVYIHHSKLPGRWVDNSPGSSGSTPESHSTKAKKLGSLLKMERQILQKHTETGCFRKTTGFLREMSVDHPFTLSICRDVNRI